MKRLTLITLTATLLAATSASAFDFITSPVAGNEASSDYGYDLNDADRSVSSNQGTNGLGIFDAYNDFGPQVSLIETGNHERAGFRVGLGYDVSSNVAPTIDGGRNSSVGALADRYGSAPQTQHLSGDDTDALALNLGFSLNF
ncbi:hypothetical protein N9L47_13940 [Rhodobacteraceae bacterium]|nr:hypothetical protein [Paracoccaceae bacterium]